MDTSRQNSAEEQKNSRMTSNHANHATYAYQENTYHQKPPSFNHKQVNISLVDDGSNPKKQQQKENKNEKQQQASGSEWRESIPIKLEHLLFNFKENSLKVYKASPPRIMQIFALITALFLFCGVLALILNSQRDDNLKKEANLPLDQSAIAERIRMSESQLLNHHKLKNSLFDQKNQTTLGEKSRKNFNTAKLNDAKDAAVRKAFGSLLFSGDDNDEIEPDPEENNSDESFDGERSRSKTNFNLFLSDNERQNGLDDQKEKSTITNDQQSENPRVMFIERLMGLHFNGLQPKFGLSESLVIRKTIGGDDNASGGDVQVPSNSNKIKETKNKDEDPTPFLLRYAAAAMLSRILATAQQQAYIQQLHQQRFREINEKNMFNVPAPYYRGYRMNQMMREPAESTMYGRPMHPHKHQNYHQSIRPGILPPFVSSDRGFSRGPLTSNEEAESQQIHPIILMLNIPNKEQSPAAAQLMFMGQGQPSVETSVQPIFMPYAANSLLPRQNPYYKPTRDQQPVYSSPFVHHKNHNYYPQQSLNEGYYAHHPYNIQPIPMNRPNVNNVLPPQQRYNHRMTNTIEVPIEIHHQVSPSVSSAHHTLNQPTAQIILQPQLESSSQPSENEQDQSNENEHHMVVFYDSSDNMGHSEENNSNSQQVFVKESKQINNDLEKANQQVGKMLLLHFVNPNNNAPSASQQPQILESASPEQQNLQRKPFSMQQDQPIIEKQQQINDQSNQNKPKLEIIKNEEENSSINDQMNREEIFEKSQSSDNNLNESEAEPSSLAHFAQVIRHVIDQQQQQNQQEQQRPQTVQPTISSQKSVSSSVSSVVSVVQQEQPQNSQFTMQQQLNQPRKEIQIENSNKEVPQIEKSQESIQSPAFAMLVAGENDEN